MVRILVPPAAALKNGFGNLYAIMGGAEGWIPVATVASGNPDYHGGRWAFHTVTWIEDVEPYLLTSEADVLAAGAADQVSVMVCPKTTSSLLPPR